VLQNYVFAGVLDRAFWNARPGDTAALFFTYAKISHNLRAEQPLEIQWGLPLSDTANGIQGQPSSAHADPFLFWFLGLKI
jgi:hypothetical protein